MAASDELSKNERNNHSPSPSPSFPSLSEEDIAATELDRISSLSDHILSTILCRVPIRIAALLSSLWRHVWSSVPLHLDDNSLSGLSLSLRPHGRPPGTMTWTQGKDWRLRTITDALTSHPGPVERFRLAHNHSRTGKPLFDLWFQILAEKGVFHIQLEFPFIHGRQDLPASLLACKSVWSLSLRNCRLPDTATTAVNFPHLTHLTLCSMELMEDDVSSILSGCPVLNSFSLIHNLATPRIRIRSPRLHTLMVEGNWVREIFIEDAKKLKRVLFTGCSESMTSLKIADGHYVQKVEWLSNDQGKKQHS